ncbi:hypothetical protein IT412_04985 [Candidatus Peregrinibacteria bacterium]|nr:hypothetical protein [Candidatus Peregrinibacteria bacterium]
MHKHDSKQPGHDHHSHSHDQESQNSQSRPHPLAGFFACLLGDEPAPISEKIQTLRENLTTSETIEETLKQDLIISKDMVVLDLINNFPKIKAYLQEIHPLGLLSPRLDQTTLELFLSDLNLDIDVICADLTKLI